MKKTLIALLALGSVAMANELTSTLGTKTATEFNSSWSDLLKDSEYSYSNDDLYTITFTISNWGSIGNSNKNILTLGDSYYLLTQDTGTYVGLSDHTTNVDNNTSTYTFSTIDGVRTLTQSSADTPVQAWVTRNSNGNNSEGRGSGNKPTITLTYDGNQTTLTLTHSASQITDQVVFSGNALDASKFVLNGNNNTSVNVTAMSITPVPEPATGSLSLLALAGLCARRRRK